MTRQPIRRRALPIELSPEVAPVSAGAQRRAWRVGRLRVVTALASVALRQVVGSGLRALALEPQRVGSYAGLLDALARDPDLLILSDAFDGVPAVAAIATARTAGYEGAIVVLGRASRQLRARLAELGDVTLIGDPITGATVAGPWLRRCLTAATCAR